MPKKLIELKNIYKSFDDEQVVKNFNLYVNKNEFVTLVGPSGCGKTTTLRMIGGFEFPDSGDIILNGERVNDIPPYHRPINTVFQRYALFPHLSVFDNIAYGLRNFNRVFEDVKSNVRKSYEKEKKALATKLQNKNTTKEEKAEIKYRFKEIKAEIKEKIFDEKEKLYDANLSEIEKRYDKKEKELLDKIEVLENDTVRINNAKDELEKLEEKIDEETSGMKKTERTKVLQKYNKELVIIRKIAYQEDVDELYAELKTVYKYRADEEKSAKSLMMSKHHIKEAVIDALKLVKLSGFQNRKISNMSGGQQQRVAIARALVNKPKILLLDEPLAALDLKLRQNMQYELKEMQRQLGITFIYVTHDQEEALTMSDIVVVMDNGEIQQIGTPQDIYNEPKNRFVASFIGESNIIRAKYKAPKQVEFMGTVFDCTDENFKNGEICDVVIRPEDFDIVPLEEAKLKGIVDSIIFKGVVYEICAIIQGVEFVIHKYEKFEVGDEIGLTVDAFEIHLMKVKKAMKRFGKLSLPYLIWMILLVIIPLMLMVVLAFLDIQGLDFKNASFTLENFKTTFTSVYIGAFFRSIKLAFITTLICIAIAYPAAYFISRSNLKFKGLILVLFILPMWSNMLLRIQTLNRMLLPEGFIKNVFGISSNLAGTEFSVVLAMVMLYLPFMVFPIYTVLEKIDYSLIEASQDLGANNRKTFQKVTLPLSLKGVASGIIMVFLPCATGFTIPEIMSGGNMILIGTIIEQKFKQGVSYNIGSLISMVIIVIIFLGIYLIGKFDAEGETLL